MKRLTIKILAKSMRPASLLFAVMSFQCAFAQLAPQQESTKGNYAGYSLSFFGSPLSPYHIVTQQDLAAVMAGYGLTALNTSAANSDAYNAPFIMQTAAPSKDRPNISADSSTDLMLGSMLIPMQQKNMSSYASLMDSAFSAPPLTANTSYAGSSIANVVAPDSSSYNITSAFAAPFNAASLFHYIPAPNAEDKNQNPFAYQKNPANVYVSLVSGTLMPQPMLKAPTPDPDYLMQVRRIAAAQSAGTYALQEIMKRSMPLSGADAAIYSNLTNAAIPAANDQGKPMSARDMEKFMATRRLNPKSDWYAHIQRASPVELQREQLYMQAEMLYELYQLHKTEEQNQMLLAVTLMQQNYNNRMTLNQQEQAAALTANPSSAVSLATK